MWGKKHCICTQLRQNSANGERKKWRKSMKKGACDLQRCCTNGVICSRNPFHRFEGLESVLWCREGWCEALREKSGVGVVWKELSVFDFVYIIHRVNVILWHPIYQFNFKCKMKIVFVGVDTFFVVNYSKFVQWIRLNFRRTRKRDVHNQSVVPKMPL